jgi:hypothetical protein
MSGWSNPLAPVANDRVRHSSGLYLTADQAVDVPAGLKNESVIIPSTSSPSWGGYFTCDLKEKPVIVKNLTLQFSPTTLTATGTAVTNYPRYVPAWFFFTRIELVINSQVVDTIYGNQQFLMTQWKFADSDRIYMNNAAGNYAAGAQRNTLAVATSPVFYVNLETFVDQVKYLLLTDAHNIQLRIYVDSLANVADLSTLTAPSSTLSACNLIADITRIPSDLANQQIALMNRTPFDSIFHDLRYGQFTVNSGITTTNIVLTPIVGKVAGLIFTIRPTASLVNASAFSYTAITSFSILNSASTNIVGGQAITSQMALQYINSKLCKSSYTTENSIGSNQTGVVQNNGANIYCWSFSSDLQAALKDGLCLNSYTFTGSEQLQITFASSLAATIQCDVYAFCESYLEQGVSYVKKVSM